MIQLAHATDRDARVDAWKGWFAEDWQNARSGTFAWCESVAACKCFLLIRCDGSLTANAAEVDGFVRDAWLPIFRMHADSGEPDRGSVTNRCGAYFPAGSAMGNNELTVQALRASISRVKPSTACGPIAGGSMT